MKADDQLQQDVIAELTWEPSVNAAQIDVEVKDGIVTLAGHVGSYIEKWDAERATQRVSGVRGLAVEMDVNLPGSSQRNDVDIVRSVENALQWVNYVPQDSIRAMVERGWITLTGEVAWEYQRKAATDGVRGLIGVTGVSNQITIKHMASPNAVKADIKAALKRRAHTDGEKISVELHGSDVTLRGRVHSWSERALVASCAWGSAGVHSVADNITVALY